jgi:hypothetical protein
MNFFPSALVHREPIACTRPENGLNVRALDHSIPCVNILSVDEQGSEVAYGIYVVPARTSYFAHSGCSETISLGTQFCTHMRTSPDFVPEAECAIHHPAA